jgi:hypothetical protein
MFLGFIQKNVDHLCVSETLNSVVLLAHQWNVAQLKVSMNAILKEVKYIHLVFISNYLFFYRFKLIMMHLKMEMK